MVAHKVVEGGSRTRLTHRIKDDLWVVRNKACLSSSAYAYSSLGGSKLAFDEVKANGRWWLIRILVGLV